MTDQEVNLNFNPDEMPYLEISDPGVLAKTPLVSVNMATYNHEPYIAQAIEGVLLQETDFPIELIIGEDCSTDRTRDIVLEYQKKHPDLIRIITSDKNVGGRKNSFRSHLASRGKYVAYCEGDDYWHHARKLQKQVDALEANPDCSMSAHRNYIFNNGETMGEFPPEPLGKCRLNLLDICKTIPFQTASVIFRKQALKIPEKYRDEMIDTFVFMLLAEQGDILYFDGLMSTYRIHGGGAWSGAGIIGQKKLLLRCLVARISYFREKGRLDIAKRLMDTYALTTIDYTFSMLRRGYVIVSIRFLILSFRYSVRKPHFTQTYATIKRNLTIIHRAA